MMKAISGEHFKMCLMTEGKGEGRKEKRKVEGRAGRGRGRGRHSLCCGDHGGAWGLVREQISLRAPVRGPRTRPGAQRDFIRVCWIHRLSILFAQLYCLGNTQCCLQSCLRVFAYFRPSPPPGPKPQVGGASRPPPAPGWVRASRPVLTDCLPDQSQEAEGGCTRL